MRLYILLQTVVSSRVYSRFFFFAIGCVLGAAIAAIGCAPERDPNQPPQQNLYSVPPRFVKCPICGNVAELKSVGPWKGAQYNCTAGHSITATNDGAGNWEFNSAQLSK